MSGCKSCGSATNRREYKDPVTMEQYYKDECATCIGAATTKVTKWTSLPLYRGAELPSDMDLIAGSNEEGKAWRLPVERVLAGGDLNKIQYSAALKTADIEIPRAQVVPVFIPGPNLPMEKAVANTDANKATLIAVVKDPNDADAMIVQNTGFLVFPRTHAYQVGKTYYLHQTNPGEVTSVKPSSGIAQPLFNVVDELTISITIGL